jgi:hypothetical protein
MTDSIIHTAVRLNEETAGAWLIEMIIDHIHSKSC